MARADSFGDLAIAMGSEAKRRRHNDEGDVAMVEGRGEDIVRIPLGHPPVVFALPGSEGLVKQVFEHLTWKPGDVTYKVFDNGEISVKVEQTVANRDVFVLWARDDTTAEVNFALMRLMLLISALQGEAPDRIVVILPSLEYARQDRRSVAGEAIPPKLLLNCMGTVGANRFLTMDLHNQAQAAFAPPGTVLDELSADMYLASFVRSKIDDFDEDHFLVCATNGGGMKFTRRMADRLRTGFIMADRFRPKAGGPGQIKIIADSRIESVKGIVIVDDMFDTCGSLVAVVEALQAYAPEARLYAVATHGYFSGEAHLQVKKLVETFGLEWLAVTNSIDQTGIISRLENVGIKNRLMVVDVSKLFAGAIIRIHLGESVNVPQFKVLGPTSADPVLQGAAMVPQHQGAAGGGSVAPASCLGVVKMEDSMKVTS